MKYLKSILTIVLIASLVSSCSNDDDDTTNPPTNPTDVLDFSGTYVQNDQVGRPAVNTVFTSSNMKDTFNVTIPSEQSAGFQSMFETNLTALSPAFDLPTDQNALGQNANAFTTLLATDVLNVTLDGKTTFFDGTNVLTGRALDDDVITVELLLIFGGEDFTENPTLSNDNVDANDKSFLTSFPYLASAW